MPLSPLPWTPLRRRSGRLAAVVVGLLLAALAAPASTPIGVAAAVARAAPSQPPVVTPPTILAVRGGGFRPRSRINANRPSSRSRSARNRDTSRAVRSFSRTLLRVLGIGFLLHLLFGIGPGGSPLGLLVLLGIVALVVLSRRRRRLHYR